MKKLAMTFTSEDVICRGMLHLPEGDGPFPVVVMGNGYATEWQFGVRNTVKAFVDAGLATFNFDYRGFGQSNGEPRQVVDVQAQLQDWRAAIRYVKTVPQIDGRRMAIWGSSLGGGHAISMAAEHPEVQALVAQVPHCCSNAAIKTVSVGTIIRGTALGLYDLLRGALGMSPIMVPVVADPGTMAVMSHPGWKTAYLHLAEGSPTWHNAIPARSLAKSGQYRPILVAERIQCPALLIFGEKDAGVPAQSVRDTAARIPHCETMAYEGDHFEVYGGSLYPKILEREVAFLKAHLLS